MALGFSLTGATKWSTCFQSAMIYFSKNLQTSKTPVFVLIKLLSWTWLRYEVSQRHLELLCWPNFELQMLRWPYFLIILKFTLNSEYNWLHSSNRSSFFSFFSRLFLAQDWNATLCSWLAKVSPFVKIPIGKLSYLLSLLTVRRVCGYIHQSQSGV